MAPLDIYAGPGALKTIEQSGLHPRLFSYFLGASGGPKWFVLAGLDRVLFPEWLTRRATPLHIIGSSAGAFRAACAVQRDPLAAVNRLAEHYSETEYSDKPTATEISDKAKALLKYVMPDQGKIDLLTNDLFKAHIIVAKCHGVVASMGRKRQLTGLALSAAANAVNRRHLKKFYTRCVFSAPHSSLRINDPYRIPTEYYELGFNNINSSLLASGSIPLVLEGVEHIVGAPSAMYRDGGIIDYHFDLELGPEAGLTLYPHFYPFAIPGWFDKQLPKRMPHAHTYDNVVMLVPSADFVSRLPYKKIPDRKDFETMDYQTRMQYWRTVLSESDRLGEYFMNWSERDDIVTHIKPLPFATQAVEQRRKRAG